MTDEQAAPLVSEFGHSSSGAFVEFVQQLIVGEPTKVPDHLTEKEEHHVRSMIYSAASRHGFRVSIHKRDGLWALRKAVGLDD